MYTWHWSVIAWIRTCCKEPDQDAKCPWKVLWSFWCHHNPLGSTASSHLSISEIQRGTARTIVYTSKIAASINGSFSGKNRKHHKSCKWVKIIIIMLKVDTMMVKQAWSNEGQSILHNAWRTTNYLEVISNESIVTVLWFLVFGS